MTSNRSDEPFDGLPDEPSPHEPPPRKPSPRKPSPSEPSRHEPMADEPKLTLADIKKMKPEERAAYLRRLPDRELTRIFREHEAEGRKAFAPQPFPPMGCSKLALFDTPTRSIPHSHPAVNKYLHWNTFETQIAGRLVTPPEGDEKGRHMVDVNETSIVRLQKARRGTLTKPLPPEGYVAPTEFVDGMVFQILDFKALKVLDEWFGIELGNPEASPFERHLVTLSGWGNLSWMWGKRAPGEPLTERWAKVEATPRYKLRNKRYMAAQISRDGS